MKNLFSSLLVATLLAGPSFAEQEITSSESPDIIINSGGLGFSKDFSKIYLQSPTVNMKQLTNSTKLQPISVDQFISFWSPQEKTSDFDKVKPNAILSSWDQDNNYLESSFIIKNVEKQGNILALNVQYLTNPTEKITPISINSKPAQSSALNDFLSGTDKAAVTVLVDCTSIFDGRC